MTTPTTVEQRLQRLEDRITIIDVAVQYATAIDAADWDRFGTLFTEQVHIDFSSAGMPAADFARGDFAGFARQGLEVWDARQHLSTNHEVEFDDQDGDRAVMRSYMYAQHHMAGASTFVMHGSYEHTMQRTSDGWRIARLVQHVSWMDDAPDGMLNR
jgi:3-phenylpropionate/cinnamic acid dioxygenase small subunit